MTAPMPNVFMVGAGRVSAALGGALRHAGVPVLGLFGRRPEAVRSAASVAGIAGFAAAPPDLLLEAEAVIVAVKDDAIAAVAQTLVDSGFVTRRHVLLHCSGSLSAAEVFGRVAERVGGVGTLHPLRAIVDARQAAASMRGTVFGVEGDERGRALAGALVEVLGGTALDLGGDGMALYHAAASMASNYLVALVDAAGEALAAAGVAREQVLPALGPLLASTLENLHKVGLPRALTGPIARGDAGTVERHLRALQGRAPALVGIYKALGRRAVALSREKGDAPGDALAAIARALEPDPPRP
jgi:predicted short-subunit dehydrogenase-like oxidoreductase (DUF2520 family)